MEHLYCPMYVSPLFRNLGFKQQLFYKTGIMGLLPDTENCGLRMRRECRERFPRYRG